jgi:hypothetical protein
MTWLRQTLGGTLTSPPSAVMLYSGEILVFSKGQDNALWLHYIPAPPAGAAAASVILIRLGGVLTSPPNAVAYGGQGNRSSGNGSAGPYAAVFARGAGSEILVWLWPSFLQPLSAPVQFSTLTISSTPAPISLGYNDLELFVTRSSELFHTRWVPATASWSMWESLGGDLRSEPYVVPTDHWSFLQSGSTVPPAAQGRRIHVYARGTPKQVLTYRYNDGNSWGSWQTAGGTIQEAPVAARRDGWAAPMGGRDDSPHIVFTVEPITGEVTYNLAARVWTGSALIYDEPVLASTAAGSPRVYSRPSAIQTPYTPDHSPYLWVFALYDDYRIRYTARTYRWISVPWRELEGLAESRPHVVGYYGVYTGWLNVFAVANGELVRWYLADWVGEPF